MDGTRSKILMVLFSLTLPWTAHAVKRGDRLTVTPARGLHLRTEATRGARSQDILFKGDVLTATGRTRDGWIEVNGAGRRGWVKGNYVTEAGYCANCRAAADDDDNPIVSAGRAIVNGVKGFFLDYAEKLGRFFGVGYRVRAYKCWRAVWEVLKKAGLVHGELTQRLAKNAFRDLKKFGFHHDPRACKTPGVIRVYDSARPGHGIGTAGDYAGHIEIMGKDRRFHHFTNSRRPMNERVGNKARPLKYCLVK